MMSVKMKTRLTSRRRTGECAASAGAGCSSRRRERRRGGSVCQAGVLSREAIDAGSFTEEDASKVKEQPKSAEKAKELAAAALAEMSETASPALWEAALELVQGEVAAAGGGTAPAVESKPRASSVVDKATLDKVLKLASGLPEINATAAEWKMAAQQCMDTSDVKFKENNDVTLIEAADKMALATGKNIYSAEAMENALGVVREAFPTIEDDELKMCTEDLRMQFEREATETDWAGEGGVEVVGDPTAKAAVASLITSAVSSMSGGDDAAMLSSNEWASDLSSTLDAVVSDAASDDEGGDAEMGLSVGEVLTPFSPYTERINGRLAMIGFALGALGEMGADKLTFAQQFSGEGQLGVFAWVLGVTLLTTINATLDKRINAVEGTPFTPELELTLGRVAMMGFVGTLIVENKFGLPFF